MPDGDLGSFGWYPDSDAQRDADLIAGRYVEARVSGAANPTPDTIPDHALVIRDQGRSNYCVRFAVARCLDAMEAARGDGVYVPASPLFLAWWDAMDGDQGTNSGTQIYLSVQAATTRGVCSEMAHPWERATAGDYLERLKHRPPDHAIAEAARHQMLRSRRIADGDVPTILAALEGGATMVWGQPVRSFTVDAEGILRNAGSLRGYHAMMARRSVRAGGEVCARVENSWSPRWGRQGMAYAPAEVMATWMDVRVVEAIE